MTDLIPVHTTLNRTILILLILAALCGGVQAGSGIWTTNGPFATGLGDKVIYVLAVSPDRSIVYCGTGSGSVFSFTLPATVPILTTVPTTVSTYVAPPSGGSDSDYDPATGPGQNQQGPLQEPSGSISVNVGGNTPVSSVVVTGTGISDTIVTATEVPGPGQNVQSPPGTIYLYLDITPARYGTITGASITFTVPQSWMDEHHFTPQDIVLYHNVGTGWQALPITVVKTENGHVYFTATSPGFSRFAIGGQTGTGSTGTQASTALGQVQTLGDPAKASVTSTPARLAPPVAGRPAAAETTAAPPAPALPETGFPLATIALIGSGCVVLAGSGWYIRRWWIRRQNPALFREYD